MGVFYSLYSTIAPREHYAFAKIAQYFPALATVGRIDLLFVYALSIVLFFFVATPLQYTVQLLSDSVTGEKYRLPLVVAINFGAFLFVLFMNKRYDTIYAFLSGKAYFIYPLLGALLPASLVFFANKEKTPQ